MKQNAMATVVEKLSSLLGSHFGVAVQYIPVTATGAVLETAKRNANAPMIVGHNQMIIPMRVEGSLVGATRIQKINNLQPKQLSQIKDTVDLILNEFLTADKKLSHISAVEEFLTGGPSNVISMSERRQALI